VSFDQNVDLERKEAFEGIDPSQLSTSIGGCEVATHEGVAGDQNLSRRGS